MIYGFILRAVLILGYILTFYLVFNMRIGKAKKPKPKNLKIIKKCKYFFVLQAILILVSIIVTTFSILLLSHNWNLTINTAAAGLFLSAGLSYTILLRIFTNNLSEEETASFAYYSNKRYKANNTLKGNKRLVIIALIFGLVMFIGDFFIIFSE